jgi:NAD+ synthase (glutamine-hydrolysing)
MTRLRLAMAQINPTVGDLRTNADHILTTVKTAAKSGAHLVLFPEMALSGYPIEDLAYSLEFLEKSKKTLELLATNLNADGLGGIAVVVGHPEKAPEGSSTGWAVGQNCASVLLGGEVLGRYAKHHLPNYSVFDEYRIFVPGDSLFSFSHMGLTFSTVICEDIWQRGGPVSQIKNNSTDVTLVLNGSPFEISKTDTRLALVQSLAKEHDCAVAYVNLVGGQDDLVFDGNSFFVDSTGSVVVRAKQFVEEIAYIDIESKTSCSSDLPSPAQVVLEEQVWNALVLGLRDYVQKNGFGSVVLGLSGGIDSAVCATLAVDALGSNSVFGVAMPSKYSSDHSLKDAEDLASNLKINLETQSISPLVEAFDENLPLTGLAAENLQARLRGVILMGLSNQHGHLVLTTGNKTELAVGYSTIYGDSVGGFAPIKDVEKTLVWKLANWRNEKAKTLGNTSPIPSSSITKPPSAELRPGQVDQDSLPEYDVLDRLLRLLIEERKSKEQIVAAGFESETVERISHLVMVSEWKRRQGAIGPKITSMAFGRDRRMPITNKHK